MTTEAGKRLLAEIRDSIDAGGGLHVREADISAIEAEAVAAERARITVGLRDLADGFGDVSAAAVLALIEETRHDRQV